MANGMDPTLPPTSPGPLPLTAPPQNPAPLPLDPDDFAKWKTRVTEAQEVRNKEKEIWQQAINSVRGEPLKTKPSTDWVNLNRDFANVKLKQALLFYKAPEVLLTPQQPLMIGRESAVSIFSAVLNAKLGVHGLKTKAMVDRVIFLTETCGIGPSKIGYEVVKRSVSIEVMDPTKPPTIDPITGASTPATTTQMTDVPVSERYFWEAFSPLKLLLPKTFEGDDYDKAPWIGMEFELDLETAKRKYNLPPDFTGGARTTDRLTSDGPNTATDAKVSGVNLYYYAALYDPTVLHPEVIRELTWLDGVDNPVEHRDCPYQSQNEDGTLTSDSMIGYPIHPLCLNYVTDVAYPPSDCTLAAPLNLEQCKGRTQMIQQRDRSLPMRWAALNRIGGQDGLNKILKNINQGILPFEEFDQNNPPIGEIARAGYPRENFEFNAQIERDLSQIWRIGANQRGAETDTVRTATEANLMQGNTDVAMNADRQKVVDWYIAGVSKLAALIQRFADTPDYVEVVGEDGARKIEQWDKRKIAGRFAFQIRPDSSIYVDAASYRKQMLDLYNFVARDPNANRVGVLTELIRSFGHDPSTLVTQQLPPKAPEPNISFRFSGDDLDPTQPRFAIVVDILKQGGITISPEVIQVATQEAAARALLSPVGIAPPTGESDVSAGPSLSASHPGMAEHAELLNKHQQEKTGGLPGVVS